MNAINTKVRNLTGISWATAFKALLERAVAGVEQTLNDTNLWFNNPEIKKINDQLRGQYRNEGQENFTSFTIEAELQAEGFAKLNIVTGNQLTNNTLVQMHKRFGFWYAEVI
jgi:nitrogenase molybdenum-iron protein alpha/beta subunit